MRLAAIFLMATMGTYAGSAPIPEEVKQNGFAVGCQAYSFNRYSVFEAIEKTAQAGGRVIEFYPGQKVDRRQPDVLWNHTATDEVVAQVQEKLKQHNVRAVNYGVVSGKDAAEWRQIFEFGKKLGVYGITTEDALKLDVIEPLVKEFDISLAIHNHPRKIEDPTYRVWDPHYIVEITKDRDSRIGACADTGHWQTSGLNPVYCLRVLKGRVISTHLKDKADYGQSHNVVYGRGVGEIGRCLAELRAQNFAGNISIEHEYNWTASVPDITRCVEFIKQWQPPTSPADSQTTAAE